MLEFDLFGHESSYYPLTARDMPSDARHDGAASRPKIANLPTYPTCAFPHLL